MFFQQFVINGELPALPGVDLDFGRNGLLD